VTPPGGAMAPGSVLTIGHSTLPLAEFIDRLKGHGVERLIDVRSVPRSRTNPQYDRDSLPAALQAEGIGYEHAAGLGGFRRTSDESPNKAWRNLSFRGYADYMQSDAFVRELDRLVESARRERVAIMCSEAVPWRCHRSLIADALFVRGVAAHEIVNRDRLQPHRLTPFARVDGLSLTYPA